MILNKIVINSPEITLSFDVEFLDNFTAAAIIKHLPIRSKTQTWGDEIYFETAIEAPVYEPTKDVNVGDFAYWPEGKCLCLFFGKTPASSGDRPMPASEVVIIGKASVEPELLRQVKDGFDIMVS